MKAGLGWAWLACAAHGWAGQGVGSARMAEDRTLPPAGAEVVLTVSAKGVQTYRCEGKEGGAAAWVFVAPEATLYAGERAVGTHGAGPVWRWMDGSAVEGKVLERQASPEAGAVPWLLLSAMPGPGSLAAGRLVGVTYVRRAETHGGAEPASGCNGGHVGAEARVPYTAAYTFYRGGGAR